MRIEAPQGKGHLRRWLTRGSGISRSLNFVRSRGRPVSLKHSVVSIGPGNGKIVSTCLSRRSDEVTQQVQNKHKVPDESGGVKCLPPTSQTSFREGTCSNAVTECFFLAPRLACAGSYDEANAIRA